MDVLNTVILALVVAAVGALLGWFARGEFAVLSRRMDRIDDRMEARFMAVQSSIEALRTDVTRLALGERRPHAGNA